MTVYGRELSSRRAPTASGERLNTRRQRRAVMIATGASASPAAKARPNTSFPRTTVKKSGVTTFANYAPADLAYWRDRPGTFAAIAFTRFESISMTTDAGSDALLANVVTPDFFTVVRGKLVLGRAFAAGDADAPVAIITARLWRRVFNRSPDAVGARLLLNSRPYTVIGVLDDSFRVYEPRIDLWLTS